MNLYEKNKIGINVKKSMVDGSPILEKLFQEINNYTKEIEETGAAVEMIAKSGEAPAVEEGDKAEGDKAGTGDKAPDAGEKGEGEAPGDKPPAGEKPDEAGTDNSGDKPPAGDNPPAPPTGGQGGGGGSHTTVKPTKTKKNVNPRKNYPKTLILI